MVQNSSYAYPSLDREDPLDHPIIDTGHMGHVPGQAPRHVRDRSRALVTRTLIGAIYLFFARVSRCPGGAAGRRLSADYNDGRMGTWDIYE